MSQGLGPNVAVGRHILPTNILVFYTYLVEFWVSVGRTWVDLKNINLAIFDGSVIFKPWSSHVPPHVAALSSTNSERLTTATAGKGVLVCVRAHNPPKLALKSYALSAEDKRG